MISSEAHVVRDFNTMYNTIFPTKGELAKSPFRSTPEVVTVTYYLDSVKCYDAMLEKLNHLYKSGKFEATFERYTVSTALDMFREQSKADYPYCSGV